MMKMKTLLSVLMGGFLTMSASTFAADPLKIGFVYVSPIGDTGWTYQHDIARLQMEKEFGDKIQTTFVESVAEGTDSERVIRNMASRGTDFIFGTSFGYMNPMLKVSKMFPKVKFEHATGYKSSTNMGNFQARDYEGRFLAGMAAGAMSKKEVIGYVGAFPIPEVIRGINAFIMGAQIMNPNIKMRVVWVNAWHDPAKEREAADSLILQGADVISFHTDSAAVVQAAESRGIYSVGFNSDMAKYGPNSHLTASIQVWDSIYRDKINAALNGTWKSESIWHGLKEGVVQLSPFHKDVPADVIAKIEEVKQSIVKGDRSVFQGPIYGQEGQVLVADGKSLTDEELLSQHWYVKGIEGKIPQ